MNARRGSVSRKIYMVITLMITLLFSGAAAYCLLWAQRTGDSAKESILYLVECQPGMEQSRILDLKSQLERSGWIKQVTYVSPDRAALLLADDELDLGPGISIDSMPELPALLSVYFRKETFDREDVLDSLTASIRNHEIVTGLYAQPDLAEMIQTNLRNIGQVLLIMAIGIFILCGFLLSSLIKLSLYADRREIKTMQLVGASPLTVQRPYLRQHLGLAFLASLLVTLVLLGLHTWITGIPPWDISSEMVTSFLILWAGITGLSILLTLVVTYRVVNKYIFADIETLF
ncbi:MAG: FtsX-like permease family protein [Saprospiraceae bacterium]|nr:hypothetical protein [Saprospiraceae bacterium]MCB9311766.1 hypothetical protein [Lewinellaceae bacterium]HRW76527.1 hypothetical protein [Saprospiraceae bacterium]